MREKQAIHKKQEEKLYRDFRKHLDRQSMGLPAIRSGAEMRLLKRIFTPEEVRIAMHLSYKPKSLDEIRAGIRDDPSSRRDLEHALDTMIEKGGIGHQERQGTRFYFILPLVVGMYEGQLYRLTSEFLDDFGEYASSRAFGLAFLGTALPQMRTIPVGRSLQPEHHVTTHDHLQTILKRTDGPIVINECICRKAAAMKGKQCKTTSRLETCMALGDMARNCLRSGVGREIDREEALEIARRNEEDGLVLQPSNSQEVEFVCACCGCCCGMLSVYKKLPRPVDFWAANYFASVDTETCTGCETCVERCPVGAVSVATSLGAAEVNLDRCLGCGNCVVTCPTGSITLQKKDHEVVPPGTREELYERIMENKPGFLGKVRLVTRLMLKR